MTKPIALFVVAILCLAGCGGEPAGESQKSDALPPPCSSSCSSFNCRGRSLGAPCFNDLGMLAGSCQNVSGRTCHVDGEITCSCGGIN